MSDIAPPGCVPIYFADIASWEQRVAFQARERLSESEMAELDRMAAAGHDHD